VFGLSLISLSLPLGFNIRVRHLTQTRVGSTWFPHSGSASHSNTCRFHLVSIFSHSNMCLFHWVSILGFGLSLKHVSTPIHLITTQLSQYSFTSHYFHTLLISTSQHCPVSLLSHSLPLGSALQIWSLTNTNTYSTSFPSFHSISLSHTYKHSLSFSSTSFSPSCSLPLTYT
jgi:hypothetical protein